MKKFKIIFSPEALKDIEQVVDYYENIQRGLGKRFADHLLITVNSIKRNPHFAPVRYDEIRCARIKKFPFLYIIILMKLIQSLQ